MTSHETPPCGRAARRAPDATLRARGIAILAFLGLLTLVPTVLAQPEEVPADPFANLHRLRGSPVTVPPRTLAVIPERHTGRSLRMVDHLERIEPQFDEFARGFGLSPERAIQIFTREARIPIYVAKTDSSVSTVLQLELGAEIEVSGMLVERGGHYLFLGTDIRTSAPRPRTPR